MAQYRRFDKDLKRYPYYYGEDKTEKQISWMKKLEVGEVFIHSTWVHWEKFKKNFEEQGVIIDRYEFKQKRMARDYKNCAAIVLQVGEEIYDYPDAKQEQMFDTNSLMV